MKHVNEWRHARYTLLRTDPEPSFCGMLGFGVVVMGVAVIGYWVGAWWYALFFGG